MASVPGPWKKETIIATIETRPGKAKTVVSIAETNKGTEHVVVAQWYTSKLGSWYAARAVTIPLDNMPFICEDILNHMAASLREPHP